MLTRGTTIALALVWGAAATLLVGCADEAVVAGADAASREPGIDAGADAGMDAAPGVDADADVEIDAGADSAPALQPDTGPDLAADLAAAAPRPGILSVPADDPDVTARELMLAGAVRAYLAVPNRVGSFAGLVLVPDERGLTDHLRDVARRFAKTGCVALVPDVGSTEEPGLQAALDAALVALASQPQVGATRTGAVGFAGGGTRALRFAAANSKVRAVVAYYAPNPMPIDLLKSIGAAVLGQYGEKDTTLDAGIAELERLMKEAGKTFEKRRYPAGSGFNDDTGPGYDEAAAVAAWPYTIGWMESYLN
jgi:carboxymethylenebutenolidase